MKMVYKLIPMFLIIILAIISKAKNARDYKFNIIIALIFCAIGDFTLQWFTIGLICFLIGHVFFIRAFLTTQESKVPSFIQTALFIFGTIMITWIGSSVFNSEGLLLTIAVTVYILVILTMGMTAFRTNSNFATAGAILFIVSDSILALNKFALDLTYSHEIIMTSYYLAQLFLAMSIANYSNIRRK
ncbi:lysoplasmalogenase [Lysinibacillus composti]|uniref:Lysoplasmalogenase n=2 Tax=Lysinibacillus composti TaxID=720633 RepID=A0A3N9U4F1_9BACI|nr:lysoplasmalogenase [Lysinibacillus composti]